MPNATQPEPIKIIRRVAAPGGLDAAPPIGTKTPPPKTHGINLKVDYRSIRDEVRKLLRNGLNKYELLLNSNLLGTIETEFLNWLESERREITAQLKNIPAHAKQKWLEERFEINDRRKAENQPLRLLTDFLFQYLQKETRRVEAMKATNQRFRKTYAKVRADGEQKKLILNYAAELGATPGQISDDKKAFSRWFDVEAVMDRYGKRVGKIELLLTFVFSRLSEVIGEVFRLAQKYHSESAVDDESENRKALCMRMGGIWKRLNIEGRIHDALIYDGDDRVHVAGLNFLAKSSGMLPEDLGTDLLDHRTIVFIHRAAMENTSDVWVQCAALDILCALSFKPAIPFLMHRLSNPHDGDDLFVRRHVLKLIESRLSPLDPDDQIRNLEVPAHADEPSPFVRQKYAKVNFLSIHKTAFQQWTDLLLNDSVQQVRAAALLAGIESNRDLDITLRYLASVEASIKQETVPFVIRTAFHCLTELLNQTNADASDNVRTQIHVVYRNTILPLIRKLQHEHESVMLRRWAAQTAEQIWAATDAEASGIIKFLQPKLYRTKPGKSCSITRSALSKIEPDKLGRIFAVLSQSDFGYDIEKGLLSYHVERGPSFGFRLWRLIYEFRNTATDKRQALRHTVGRISTATMRAPSQILGELSETKVPGEPLTIADDGTWRPFIPLLDDFVSVLNLSWFRSRTVKFYTSQGITTVNGPRRFFKQIQAAWKLTFCFGDLADKRNWDEDSYATCEYIDSMREIGFEIEFREYEPWDGIAASELNDSLAVHPTHEGEGSGSSSSEVTKQKVVVNSEIAATDKTQTDGKTQTDADTQTAVETTSKENLQTTLIDESVGKFFYPTLAILPLLGSVFDSAVFTQLRYFSDYFISAFENSLEQLVIFSSFILLLVMAKHLWANYTFRVARRKIPISIGGWGTRGKSGTERLKAALIGGMGHGLVSKTTGCEAMFIHANANGDPLEIPFFRPYDKATIWEQRNLIRMASQMDPSVFLWECMALTPSYVDVLQRQWTTDDMGTITNTYPDHEDVQGPAGYNVAETISGFVPLNSHLISSEQVMRPYVTESCRLAKTSFRGIGWLESGLITDDVLDRFPYKEHPDNIALVAAMGDELGCDYEFCLKAMADQLVPDLGVLKTHPVSIVRTRKIEFTNGMSANERFGCMGNWKRLGFDQQDPWEEPATWISGVVNNRADRVPRSKVFAKIIVEDIHADRFYLIGNNLRGLIGFIQEEWEHRCKSLSLRDKGKKWDKDFAIKTLKKAAKNYRQPILPEHVQERMRAAAIAIATTVTPDAIDVEAICKAWERPKDVKEMLEKADVDAALISSVEKHQFDWIKGFREYSDMISMIENWTVAQVDSIEFEYATLLRMWFDRKIVIVEEYDATGEEVVERLVDETPPGFLNRAMGLQNIKGTGLDFVYRFQAWDICDDACTAAMTNQVQISAKGLQALVAMPAIGQLCENRVRSVLKHAKTNSQYRRPELKVLIQQLEQKLAEEMGEESVSPLENAGSGNDSTKANKKSRLKSRSELNEWLMESAEQFLDVHDSIRRRKRADLIYRDLADERISRQRAVVELRKINKRQKGGWLSAKQ